MVHSCGPSAAAAAHRGVLGECLFMIELFDSMGECRITNAGTCILSEGSRTEWKGGGGMASLSATNPSCSFDRTRFIA